MQEETTLPLAEPAKRLPYEAPAVISEEVFETLALSCAVDGALCAIDPQSS